MKFITSILISIFIMNSIYGVIVKESRVEYETTSSIFVKNLAQEKGVRVSGYNGDIFVDFKKFAVNFRSCQKLPIDEARRLYVDCCEKMIVMINNNRKIKKMFKISNADHTNLDFTLSFGYKDSGYFKDGSVINIYIDEDSGNIVYRSYTTDNVYHILLIESYQDALKKCAIQ